MASTLGIDLHHTTAGHIFEKVQRAKPWCTKRQGSRHVFEVRRSRYARKPRYIVDFTLDDKGEPVSALCVDRWGEQCKANEFRGGCYHVAAALLRFYRHRPLPATKGKVFQFHRRPAA